jgi:hypothetical protein
MLIKLQSTNLRSTNQISFLDILLFIELKTKIRKFSNMSDAHIMGL